MMAKDMLPISFDEGKGFRSLIEFIEFTVPLRKTITAKLEKLYDDNANELRTQLATDSWTALTTESYLTVTCHYILNWEIHSAVLQTNTLPAFEWRGNLKTSSLLNH